jgi:putative oxygen-independent coproporphyrinogen III oxidase
VTGGPASPIAAAPPVGLYLHIPFCVSLCPYCDFVVYSGADARGPRARVERLLGALQRELSLRADALDARWGVPDDPEGADVRGRPPLDTVYLGGGTPSLLPARDVAGLLALVRRRFGLADGAEITIEVNPGPDERGDLDALAAAGINRISLGGQSFEALELRRLGRRHRPVDIAMAVAAARAAGIGSVGLDLLYDVPGQTLASWARSLDAALALGPDHVSLYALTLDDPDAEGLTGANGDHLPLRSGARRWREAARREQDDDRAADAYALADARLSGAGLDGYEISNWCRPGRASRHNLAYWERRPYEAVGPGAHAFDGSVRRWNAAPLAGYLAALDPPAGSEPSLPPGDRERLSETMAAAEAVVLGLRLAEGVPAGWAEVPPLDRVAPWAIANGLLERSTDRLRLTLRGRLLSNEVFARLV